ncbi:MAG: OmpA family protein [Nitrospiraceae bacterium]|nr:OmpA family protein [Nitrospiraceae bacterium]
MNDRKVVIKKKIKKVEEGHHGGAWKVAYADFMTAMMAFFMLLWLISMIAPEKRAKVAQYFRDFSIFQKTGQSFMTKSSSVFDESGANASKITLQMEKRFQGSASNSPVQMQQMLKRLIRQRLGDVKDQIRVDIIQGGVRIQIMDKKGRPMFDSGSANPTPAAKRILGVIGEFLENAPNKIALEGHTDALPYVNGRYTNWDLSVERALAARTLLVADGLESSRLSRVTGYGDTIPFVKDDPLDPRNRRISVIVLFQHSGFKY